MATFEQTTFAFDPDDAEKAIETASKVTKITQELRRPRPEAPRVAVRPEMPLDDEEARQRLERRIAAHLPAGRLSLAVTDNRYTIISVKRDKGPFYRARVHHMFLDAPPHVTRSLARYIALNEAQASRELGSYIEANQEAIRRRRGGMTAPPVTLRTIGQVFNLQEVYDDLNARYFDGRIDARITWGPRGGRRRRRTSIKMGSYSVEERLIRIHPSLDRRFVPRFFLEWIVYHEMLHQVHDIPVVDGRRRFHTPAFLEQERQFDRYDEAVLWERRHLDKLLTY